MTGKLKREIKQKKPFSGVHEEVVLGLMRTADQIAAPMTELLRGTGVSLSQYNVLRILRGAGDDGLPCGEISERMVRRDPDLTRLLDALEKRGLVSRERGVRDRRVVMARITDEGLKLLDSLDDPVITTLKGTLSHVPVSRLRELVDLLEEIRSAQNR